jgi:LuxR family maltose regulon positive regulatory protein
MFDHEETRRFLGSDVTAAQARQFLKLTSGWPVLMQLLRPEYKSSGQWLKRSDARVPAAAAEFIARHLSTQLDETRHIGLRKLALLPGFDAELASELVEPTYASELFETLVREKLLIRTSSSPGAGDKLIVQPLMRAWLLQEMSRSREPWITTGRQLAIRRYLQEDHTLQAVRVAVESGDPDLLVETVESIDLVHVWMMSGLPRLRRILSLLPASLVDTCPRVAYARVVYLIKCGRLSEANRLFDAATRMNRECLRQRSGSPPEETVDWHLCRSMLSIYRGTPMSYPDIQAFEEISMENSRLQPVFRALTSTLKCYVHQQRGNLEEAKNEAWLTIGTAKQAHSEYLAYYMYCDLGIIHGLQGQIGDARTFFDSGDSHCRQTLRDDERLAVIRDTFRLELEHELDPLDNSSIPRLRNICRRLHQLEGWPDVFAAAFKTYSEKLCFEENVPAAIVTIDAGLQYARDEEMIGLVTILESQRAILSCLAGDPADASKRLQRLLSGIDLKRFSDSQPWREVEAIAEACAVLDRIGETSRHLESVHAALEWFRKCGNLRSGARLDSLLATMNPEAGDPETSVQSLSKFRRGEVLIGRIDEVRRRLAGRQSPGALPASAEEINPAYFTEKETAVLEGLCKGWSDKQIARELGISAHGVRYHLKKIYGLMNIRNRNEVRDRIQELDLLGRQRFAGSAPQTEPQTKAETTNS